MKHTTYYTATAGYTADNYKRQSLPIEKGQTISLMRKVSLLLTALFMLVTAAGAATYTVTTTADSGVGSLRQAIIDANASGTAGIVQFSIPAGGAQVITLNSALPPITVKLDINGYTQPGSIKPGATWPAKIMVQLQGNGNYNGLEFTTAATGSSVTGMSIVGFGTDVDHAGIYTSAPNVTIAGNLIGLKNEIGRASCRERVCQYV